MKQIFALALSVLMLMGCQEKEVAPKDYVSLSGKITNKNSDSLMIRTRTFSKTVQINEDGTFSDTLKVEPGIHYLVNGGESAALFLKNGYDLQMSLDTKEFDESIAFNGMGAVDNNYLAAKALKEEQLFDADFGNLTMEQMNAEFLNIESKLNAFMDANTEVDTMLLNQNRKDLGGMLKSYKGYFGEMIALKRDFPKGATSPSWEGYENFKGGTTSLADLKGKYVYIDVWATWCAPCKAEIPSLKELEHDYEGKNIAFVSMSIDDDRSHGGSWEKAKEDWRAMVADKELGGIQIYAPKGWQTEFIKNYRINGIPRFILIDPDGNIVDASAPRPSDPKIRTMFDEALM